MSLQEYLFTGSSKASSCGFWQKRARLSDLLEGALTALQETTLTVLLVLPRFVNNSVSSQILESLFAILVECSQFCFEVLLIEIQEEILRFAGGRWGEVYGAQKL